MIPKRLIIHNFGSHIHTDYTFNNDESLIGIVGRWSNSINKSNGSGKSTFVDAILYALFNKSRVSGSSDNVSELIREGQNEMYVNYTFSYNNQLIDILKESKISKSNKIKNRFVVTVNGDKKSETPNEGKLILSEIFNVDYEIFIATSFFMQGKADNFLNATSSEKLEYLRKIDKLEIFETAKKLVNKDLKDKNTQFTELQGKSKYIDEEIATINENEINNKILNYKQELNTLQLQLEDLNKKQLEYTNSLVLLDKKQNLEKLIQQRKNELLKQVGIITSSENKIENLQKENDELKSLYPVEIDRYNNKEYEEHKDYLNEIKNKILIAENEVLNYNNFVLAKKDEYELLINKKISIIGKDYKPDISIDTEIDKIIDLENELKKKYLVYEANKYKIDILDKKILDIKNTDTCFNCGAKISEEKKNKQILELQNEKQDILKYEKYGTQIKEIQESLKNFLNIKSFNNAYYEVVELQSKIADLPICKYNKEYIDSLQREKDLVESRFKDLSVLKQKYDNYCISKDKIDDNLLTIKFIKEKIEIAIEQQKKINEDLDRERKEIDLIVIGDFKDMTNDIKKMELTKNNMQQEITKLESILTRKHTLESQIASILQERQKIHQDIEILNTILGGFDKNGIPFMIAQNTLQFVENFANSILNEINSNMEVEFLIEKETKTGNVNEVVEIIIKMDGIKRNYNTFSGGEKALINFAIRMGISTYLTNKNNSSIEMVILDEVFAALDDENRYKIFAMLNSLKNRFNKILAISHTKLKDIFPSIIEFIRDEEGTRIN